MSNYKDWAKADTGGGISSINNNTNSSQFINAGFGINVDSITTPGTTVISAGNAAVPKEVSAPFYQMSVGDKIVRAVAGASIIALPKGSTVVAGETYSVGTGDFSGLTINPFLGDLINDTTSSQNIAFPYNGNDYYWDDQTSSWYNK
jgi:hypothetical protein